MMINFSKISSKSFIGKFLRWTLKLIPKNCVLPILQGKLKGTKWIIGSGVYGYWLGCYELEKQKLFIQKIKKGDVVYDVGAHVGFYTLLASKLVGKQGWVYAFEPNPQNAYFLLKHIQLNKIKNVKLILGALGENYGLKFLSNKGSESKIEEKNLKSEIITPIFPIDDLVLKNKIIPPPQVLKIDVEGYELNVLKGAKQILKKHKPILFVALDNEDTKSEVYEFIKNLGYNIFDLNLKKIEQLKINNYNEIICF